MLVFMLLGLLRCGLSAGVHVAEVATLLIECWCSCFQFIDPSLPANLPN